MHCKYCNQPCIKKGLYKGVQKAYCKTCHKYQRSAYTYGITNTTNIYKTNAPDRVKNIGEKGWVDPAGWQYLDQKSNGVYSGQNSTDVGKTVLGVNSKTHQFVIVSQEDGKSGFTLDQIRDRLAKEGYNNVVAFDGSTSSTLVEDGKAKVSPDNRKNNTMTSGLNLSVPKQ